MLPSTAASRVHLARVRREGGPRGEDDRNVMRVGLGADPSGGTLTRSLTALDLHCPACKWGAALSSWVRCEDGMELAPEELPLRVHTGRSQSSAGAWHAGRPQGP